MLETEHLTQPYSQYMRHHSQINENIRAQLVDHLVIVHGKFKLLPETLFLTINLIDRFLAKHQIQASDMRLLGISAMLIATKYEEIYPPTVKDFIIISGRKLQADHILQMEMHILTTIEFEVQQTSPFRFLERFTKLGHADSTTFHKAWYLLELALLDSKMN